MSCLTSIVWNSSGLTQSFSHSHEILTFTQISKKFDSGYILHRYTLAARVYINYKKKYYSYINYKKCVCSNTYQTLELFFKKKIFRFFFYLSFKLKQKTVF